MFRTKKRQKRRASASRVQFGGKTTRRGNELTARLGNELKTNRTRLGVGFKRPVGEVASMVGFLHPALAVPSGLFVRPIQVGQDLLEPWFLAASKPLTIPVGQRFQIVESGINRVQQQVMRTRRTPVLSPSRTEPPYTTGAQAELLHGSYLGRRIGRWKLNFIRNLDEHRGRLRGCVV
ncbi:MAG: hypothetical protein ACR2NP_17050 [Pirellulaceae bacterium]